MGNVEISLRAFARFFQPQLRLFDVFIAILFLSFSNCTTTWHYFPSSYKITRVFIKLSTISIVSPMSDKLKNTVHWCARKFGKGIFDPSSATVELYPATQTKFLSAVGIPEKARKLMLRQRTQIKIRVSESFNNASTYLAIFSVLGGRGKCTLLKAKIMPIKPLMVHP